MYCPSCAKEVVAGLTYCNHCGHRLNGAKADNPRSEVKPELLVSAMVGLFILGLLAIAVLIGVLKQVAGFEPPLILAILMLSFVLMFIIEGVLTWMLLRGRKVEKEERAFNQLNEQAVKEIYAAPTRGLSEPTSQPVSTVTEHTTRTLEHVPKNNL
jgi:type VI protein secretion system component VasK